MTWLFAALLLLALAGIALVAAGHGAPLSRVYADRPDVVVPSRPLAGEDLRRVRFPLALRGYRMAEVDALLARLATELDERATPEGPRSPGDGTSPEE